MKLNHEVVKDLYPLYIEKELSPSVQQAVEVHLQECEECRNIYKSEDGFFDPLKKIDEPNVPRSVDDKLLLRLKLNRLKWITFFLIGIIFTMIITDYKNDREKLFLALENYYGTQRYLSDTLEVVKNKDYSHLENVQETVHQLVEDKMALEEHFNFIEKQNLRDTEYFLNVETHRFTKMLEILQYRFDQGMWSEIDEAAYQAIQEHFKTLNVVVTKEYEEMHHGYSSYFVTLDIKAMNEFYEEINVLSDSYTRFHKLPEQIKPMKVMDVKQTVAKVLDSPSNKIDIKKESPLNYAPYTYRFEVSGKKILHGRIDGLTGQIIEIDGISDLNDDPLISKESADKTAREYIEKIYGSSLNFEIVSLGFNYNISANDPRFKIYSYKVIPVVKGIKLYTPFDNGTFIHIDARTGELHRFDHNPYAPSLHEFEETDTTIKVPLESLNDKGIGVQETVVIYSLISGEFELVHKNPSVGDFQAGKFYSAETGNEEWIYSIER
jgi:hypothetical protein